MTDLSDAPEMFLSGQPQKGREWALERIFTYHPPDPADLLKYQEIRVAAHAFAAVILANTPPCSDQLSAIRKVREAVMTANSAIALKGLV